MDWGARVVGAARAVSRAGLWFGGALILLAALLIGVDVLVRRLFDRSIGGADELSGYALAIGFAWAMPATLLDRGHIRIDSLYIRFPGALRALLDIVGLILLLALFGLIAWHGFGVVEQSWLSGSRSQSALEVPTVIPQALWWAGLLFFLAIGVLVLVRAMLLLSRGERAALVSLIGTRSAEEEVAEELRSIQARRTDLRR